MMNKYILIFLFVVSIVNSQDIKESIKTQQITVSKSYAPELTNINKIRSVISINDLIRSDKVTVTYNLIEIPVASTFKPNKASPLTLKRNFVDESSFNSHFDLGIGNTGQLNLDFSSHMIIDRSQGVGLDIINTNYGDVNLTQISSDESLFVFGLDHILSSQKMEIVHKIFLNQHSVNYYGIYHDSSKLSDPLLFEKIISIQERNSINLLSNWKFYNSFLKGALLNVKFLNDSSDSKEEMIDFKTDMLIPVFRMNLLLVPKVSYVNTFFNEDYFNRQKIKSFYTKFETSIQLSSIEDKLKYQVGGTINYILKQSSILTPEISISPKIMISYGLNGSKFQSYLILNGGVEINNYSVLSNSNPYVAPTLNLIPTQNLYIGRIGFKSSFDSGLDLNVGSHFKKQLNAPLFKRYAYDPSISNQGYRLANSYGLVYDEISQYGFFGEASINFGKENFFKISLWQFNYDLDKVSHPWNLPNFEGRVTLDLKIADKLRINLLTRHIGERPSAYRRVFLNQAPENSPTELKILSPISQIKAEINYRLAPKWQTYLRSQFNIGSSISQWDSYVLNQKLLLVGMRYSFDLTF